MPTLTGDIVRPKNYLQRKEDVEEEQFLRFAQDTIMALMYEV